MTQGHRLRRGTGPLALAAALFAGAAVAEPTSVVVLTGQRSQAHDLVIEGFEARLRALGRDARLAVRVLDEPGEGGALPVQDGAPSALVLSLGSSPTQLALGRLHRTPVVAALIVHPTDIAAPNATGVLLDHPIELQLRALRRVLPANAAVGVLFDPAENSALVEAAAAVAGGIGLRLVLQPVSGPSQLPSALDRLEAHASVIWGIPDHTVFTATTAKQLLVYSFRNRIPLTGLSVSWVKAGALYALERDYRDLGAQCAELAAQILNGTPPSALPPVPPRKVLYYLNRRTAEHMRLGFPSDLVAEATQVFD